MALDPYEETIETCIHGSDTECVDPDIRRKHTLAQSCDLTEIVYERITPIGVGIPACVMGQTAHASRPV